MEMTEMCPCPKVDCPNHGDCAECTSRHLRLGFLNYCAFHTILPTIEEAIAESPESATAKKLDGLMKAQRQAYDKLIDKHGLSPDDQAGLLKKVSQYSDH